MIEKAIESYEREVRLTPNVMYLWLNLAGLKAQLGRDKEAKEAAKEVLRLAPDYYWEKYSKAYLFTDKEVERRFFEGLRKVGLK
jgi:tetratricopeptide (TPR) repeat protein